MSTITADDSISGDPKVFPLLELPDELIVQVLTQLQEDDIALSCFPQTCHRLQPLTEPLIYQDIFVRTSSDLIELVNPLGQYDWRASALRRLDCRGLDDQKHESHHSRTTWRKIDPVRSAESMRSLFSPLQRAANRETVSPAERPLQNLHSLVLHHNGDSSRYWDVEPEVTGSVFAHPTLRELTISCANIPNNALKGIEGSSQLGTPLARLTLIECNITHKALHDMLSLPKALHFLHLFENIKHHPSSFPITYNSLSAKNPKAFFAALEQQAFTLEELVYHASPNDATKWAFGSRFHNLSKLYTLSF